MSINRIRRTATIVGVVTPLMAVALGLTGRETFTVTGLEDGPAGAATVHCGSSSFPVRVRLDTPYKRNLYRQGGILPSVVRRLVPAAGVVHH
jgi:aconitate hydratase